MKKEEVLKKLKDQGLRATPVRLAILGLLTDSASPLSAEKLIRLLKTKKLSPNKTTIYRELATLAEAGILESADVHGDTRMYELASGHHHHVSCTNCGAIAELAIPEQVEAELSKLASKTGFKGLRHALAFYGTCTSCS